MKKELNEKQKLFCLEYLKDFNGTQAYKKVYGGTDDSARRQASRLLTNVHIATFIAEKAKQKTDETETGIKFVLDTLNEVIQIGLGKKTVELEEGKEKKVLDLSNVNSALEKLGKYHKMYTDKVEQEGNLSIEIISYKDKQDG